MTELKGIPARIIVVPCSNFLKIHRSCSPGPARSPKTKGLENPKAENTKPYILNINTLKPCTSSSNTLSHRVKSLTPAGAEASPAVADRFYDAMSLTWGCSKVGSPLGWSYSKKAITQPSRSNLEGSTKNFESVRTLNAKPFKPFFMTP